MKWVSVKKIIRRFLRDPNGNIWDDAQLLNAYNDEQKRIDQMTSLIETVENVRVPPNYQMSYVHDFEWAFRDQNGKSYQCFSYHQQSDMTYCYRWETQSLGYSSASESDSGDHFTHPWEAWYVTSDCGDLVPVWFPEHFETMLASYWDREPLDYVEYKMLQSNDMTYRTRKGLPAQLYRIDEVSNEAYLYPLPSSPVWDDHDDDPALMGVSGDTYNSNYGTLNDATGTIISSDEGQTADVVSEDDNLMLIYRERPHDIDTDSDDGNYPTFIQKYIRYGVLEYAYKANTDGRIQSLSDYWGWRKMIGLDALKRFKGLRKTDRDYRLISQPAINRGNMPRRTRTGSYESIFGQTGVTTS